MGAMSMVRKQVYLGSEHEQKVRRVAARRGCTEAAVIRQAIEALPDPDASIEGRLAAAGLLVRPAPDDDLPEGRAAESFERSEMERIAAADGPLGLAEAVLEDRR